MHIFSGFPAVGLVRPALACLVAFGVAQGAQAETAQASSNLGIE
jgi:hypothetical protein